MRKYWFAAVAFWISCQKCIANIKKQTDKDRQLQTGRDRQTDADRQIVTGRARHTETHRQIMT